MHYIFAADVETGVNLEENMEVIKFRLNQCDVIVYLSKCQRPISVGPHLASKQHDVWS